MKLTQSLYSRLIILVVLAGVSAMLIVFGGCSGNSSSSSVNTGVFVDSPVAGLDYRTETQSGITGPNGEFQYIPGETVVFSIGDVVVGSAVADTVITPIHLSPNKSTTDPQTINVSRFLQSLDADGNLDNGIQITPETKAEMRGRNIAFSKAPADFEDSEMTALFTTLTSKNMFTSVAQGRLRTETEAMAHLQQSLANITVHMTHPVLQRYTSIIKIPRYRNYTTVNRTPIIFPRITSVIIRPRPPVVFPRITSVHIVRPLPYRNITTIHIIRPRIAPDVRAVVNAN
jgi:hypothetical protein